MVGMVLFSTLLCRMFPLLFSGVFMLVIKLVYLDLGK